MPKEVWSYNLGNQSGLEWAVEQFKEKAIRDAALQKSFNTYRFADHKEEAISLIARVVTVSMKTLEITDAMKALPR